MFYSETIHFRPYIILEGRGVWFLDVSKGWRGFIWYIGACLLFLSSKSFCLQIKCVGKEYYLVAFYDKELSFWKSHVIFSFTMMVFPTVKLCLCTKFPIVFVVQFNSHTRFWKGSENIYLKWTLWTLSIMKNNQIFMKAIIASGLGVSLRWRN